MDEYTFRILLNYLFCYKIQLWKWEYEFKWMWYISWYLFIVMHTYSISFCILCNLTSMKQNMWVNEVFQYINFLLKVFSPLVIQDNHITLLLAYTEYLYKTIDFSKEKMLYVLICYKMCFVLLHQEEKIDAPCGENFVWVIA